MEKSKSVRKSHTSTADLLTWTENAPTQSPAAEVPSRPGILSHQPSAGVSAALFGGQMTEEESESLMKPKICSSSKLKELTGSGIFAGEQENSESEEDASFSTPINRTGLRLYQQGGCAVSQISFSAEENVSPKKPITLPEMAKQRELSGSLESESNEARLKKQLSNAKTRELSGHGVLFSPPPEIPPPPPATVSAVAGGMSSIILGEEPVVKTARKIYDKKFTELSGSNVFNGSGGDGGSATTPPASAEKLLSGAKLREMTGSDIFADEKINSREYYGGVRKPPGGESTIALV